MKRKIMAAAVIIVAAVLLWLLFRGTDWAELLDAIKRAKWGWLLLSLVPIVASFFLRIQRWSYVVRAVKRDVSWRAMFSSTQIAFLANTTVGLRSGEFIRPLVLGRLGNMSYSKGLAMTALDRVNDLVSLIVLVLVTASVFRPSEDLVLAAGTLGNAQPITVPADRVSLAALMTVASLVGIVSALVALYVSQDFTLRVARKVLSPFPEKVSGKLCGMLEHFAQGLHVFRSLGDMAKSIFFGLLTWACFLAAGQCGILAFGLDCPWYTVLVMQSLVALAVSAPGVPGMLGQFHFPVVVTLVMVANVSTVEAKAVAIVLHIVNIMPAVLLGFFCLMWENMSLVALTREGAEAEHALETAEASLDSE